MKILKAVKKLKKLWMKKKKRPTPSPDHTYYNHPPPPPCLCHFCQFPQTSYQVEPTAPPLPEDEEEEEDEEEQLLVVSSQQEVMMILETDDQTQVHPKREIPIFGCFIRCFLPCFGIDGEREKKNMKSI